jgi:hypothetical protein
MPKSRTLSQILIFQHVESRELGRVDALDAQHLDARAREPALRRLGRALHEQHDRRRGHRLINRRPHLLGKESHLEGSDGRHAAAGGERPEGRLPEGLRPVRTIGDVTEACN